MITIITKPTKILEAGRIVKAQMVFWRTINSSTVFLGVVKTRDEVGPMVQPILNAIGISGFAIIEHN